MPKILFSVFELSAWKSLSTEHDEVLSKIQLLEKASIDLLRQRTKELSLAKALKLQKDFLDMFRVGMTQHFMIEEEALFPILRIGGGNEAKTLVSELLAEHRAMMEKYFKIKKGEGSAEDHGRLLLMMLKDLSAHSQKEENSIPPLMKRLNKEQLNRINEVARRLGYRL